MKFNFIGSRKKISGTLGKIGGKLPTLPLDHKFFGSWTREQYRTFAIFLAGLMGLMVFIGTGVFFLALRGAEQTLIPDVRGLELPEAMIKLQERELYPRLSLRFTDNPADRNTILEQSPAPGTIVKAGRRVQLTVSRGAVIDKIEDYIGKNIDEVKIHLQTLFASSRPLVTVKDPPVYLFNGAPAGTILEQKPKPGTEISSPALLELVVSRGPEKATMSAPELASLSLADAVAAVEKGQVVVDFAMRPAKKGEQAGAVVEQNPAPGALMNVGDRLSLTLTAPAQQKGVINGIFSHDLPDYPYAVPMSLDALKPSGERVAVLSLRHPGGKFSAPFSLPENSILILTVLDREVTRAEVK